jgi:ArsR family transcriptional regulator
MDGEMCVGDLEKVTKSSQSNLSQHLCKMKGLSVIVSEKRGQQVYYRIANPAFSELIKALKVIYCPDL